MLFRPISNVLIAFTQIEPTSTTVNQQGSVCQSDQQHAQQIKSYSAIFSASKDSSYALM